MPEIFTNTIRQAAGEPASNAVNVPQGAHLVSLKAPKMPLMRPNFQGNANIINDLQPNNRGTPTLVRHLFA